MNNNSTPSSNSISNPTYKNYALLPRLVKGYFFEMELQDIAGKKGIEYTANPRQFEEYCKHTNTGYDMKVKDRRGTWIEIEAKFTLVPIAHCWFMRDWLSRSANIFVTNDKYNVSYSDRRTLEQQHRKLLSTTEFAIYLDKLMEDGNHYSKWNTIVLSITNVIKRIGSILSASTLDKWIENKDGSKQKEDNTLGDSASLKEKLKMAEESDNTTRIAYPKKRKGKLTICSKCFCTFIAHSGEKECPDCRETGQDDSTRTFGTPLDGLFHPLE